MNHIRVIDIVPSGIGGIQSYADMLEKNLRKESIATTRVETYTVVDNTENTIKKILKKILRFFSNLITLFFTIRPSNYKNILHCHIAVKVSFWENALYGLWGYVLGVPFVFHIHSSLLHKEFIESNLIVKSIRKNILNKATKIIALSDYWQEQLLQMEGVLKDRFVTLHNFIDVDSYGSYELQEARELLGLPMDKKILFSVGRLTERKGYQYLVEAINKIAEWREDFIVIIGGKGHLYTSLKHKIDEYKLSDIIRLEGFIPDELLPVWLQSMDIFVLPSLRETFPIVMLEALACGKPVVGTNIAAMPEVLNSEDFGFLVEAADSSDLAKKILQALDKEWDREKIIKYAARFSWDHISEKLIEVYWNSYMD